MAEKQSITSRFLNLVSPEPNSGCWLWTGRTSPKGYGKFQKSETAHRVAYELYRAQIPKNLVLDHLCRVRCCVNPYHLEAITNAENIARGSQCAKTHCPKGHPFDERNTYLYMGGGCRRRECRACHRERKRAQAFLRGSCTLTSSTKLREEFEVKE